MGRSAQSGVVRSPALLPDSEEIAVVLDGAAHVLLGGEVSGGAEDVKG